MALHACHQEGHIPFHGFFFLRAKGNIHMSVFTNEGNAACHFVAQVDRFPALGLVNECDVTIPADKEEAFVGFVVHGAGEVFPHLVIGYRERYAADFFVHMHGDSQAAGLVFVKLHPYLLAFGDAADHFCERQEDAALGAHIDESAEAGGIHHRRIADAAYGNLGQPHAGGQAMMGVVIQEDPHLLPFFHFVGLLAFVQQDVIFGIAGAAGQEGAESRYTDHRKLSYGVFFVNAFLPLSYFFHLFLAFFCVVVFFCRRFLPQGIEIEVASFFIGEDVNDHVAEVQENPVPFSIAFLAGGADAQGFHLFFHFVSCCLGLLLVSGGCQDEIVRNRGQVTDIQNFDQNAFFAGQCLANDLKIIFHFPKLLYSILFYS